MTEDICPCIGECLVFPLVEAETRWPTWLRIILYMATMAWCFVGVSIVADTFMGAIEAVTSRRRQTQLPNGKIMTARVWNDTVANLTLMALGSSAPEILLAVIDLFKRDMTMGQLGPQTIVGSASFNLFMIVGICIAVIPSTESRRIRQMPVFFVTTIFMFFAYLWLVFSISANTPGIIDIWEAAVTLLSLPLLVLLSYMADIGALSCCNGRSAREESIVQAQDVAMLQDLVGSQDRETRELCKVALALRPKGAPHLSELSPTELEAMRKQVIKGRNPRKSRAARRVEATRALTGSRRVSLDVTSTFTGGVDQVAGVTGASIHGIPLACAKGTGKPTVTFACSAQTMSFELTSKHVVIKREGNRNPDVSLVIYFAVNAITRPTPGLASMQSFAFASEKDIPTSRVSRVSKTMQTMQSIAGINTETVAKQCCALEMDRNEFIKFLNVPVPRSNSELVGFMVEIVGFEVQGSVDDDPSSHVELGEISITEVEIGREEIKGVLAFCFEQVMIQGTSEKQRLEVMVQRQLGCSGTVSCSYRTESLTAVPGHDYQDTEGELIFEEGVTEQFIEIEILPKGQHESKDQFLLVLDHAEGGAFFASAHDGGDHAEICTVTIATLSSNESSRFGAFMRTVDAAMNFDALRLGHSEWKEALVSAVYCNGSPEEQGEASKADWVFHIIALPWKLCFCLIPPTAYFHGWLCFWVSLLFIGLCTVFIGDLAELFGCVLGVDDTITAIIFVALGTSMPDLFASRMAATQDPFADASIVNVTGSNCVNVFLGLGLPWTIGSIYWTVTGRTAEWSQANPEAAAILAPGEARFTVEKQGLVFSVLVFCTGAMLAVCILMLRRKVVGAELGGPFRLKVASSISFVMFWFLDISLVSWYTIRWDAAPASESVAVILAVTVSACVLISITLGCACQTASRKPMRALSEKGDPAEQGSEIENGTSVPAVQCSV